ncbi:MAG TPA: transcription-repair coupling factor [Blastocatellia bacterium]|nr:transcription-repair coupling factor [Blastocatellia bacterium]
MATNTPIELTSALFGRLFQSDEIRTLASLLDSGSRAVVLSGLAGSARGLVVTALASRLKRLLVFVTSSNRAVEEFQSDLSFFHSAGSPGPNSEILVLPAPESDPYDGTSPHAEVLEQRALTLYRLASLRDFTHTRGVVLTSLRALAQRTVSPKSLVASGIELRVGEDMPLELVVDLLIASGYVRREPVSSLGEFSVRGGILDVFSPAQENPHRLEFFGDTVDSIREFDPDTQRSISRAASSTVAPMRELAVRREDLITWADTARKRWGDERFRRDLHLRVSHAERGETFPGWEYLVAAGRQLESSALDYLANAAFVIDEPVDIERTAIELYSYLDQRHSQADDAGELVLPPQSLFLTADELRTRLTSAQRVELRLIGKAAAVVDEQFRIESLSLPDVATRFVEDQTRGDNPTSPDEELANGISDRGKFLFTIDRHTPEITLLSQSPRRYYGKVQELAGDLKSEPHGTAVFVLPSLGLAERVAEMLAEYDVSARLAPQSSEVAPGRPEQPEPLPVPDGARVVTVGRVSNGFAIPSIELDLLIEGDIFGDVERPRPPAQPKQKRKRRAAAAFLSDLGDLKQGDYVVHIDHGIGQFQGLKQISVADGAPAGGFNLAEGLERTPTTREFMLLIYADGAKLYVPVERLDLVQRYSAGEGHKPQLDRLGGVGWQKTKARARRAMRDMTEELLKLYAERKVATGYGYGADTPWQKEFEDAFEYQLTPDQESAVEDVKSGMERIEPMDRLIVGDVGYGKTEVAMRAAFKAVIEGKQVAVLAPTTVLVYQHYKTFQQRFSAFPARIDMLSRFRSTKEQRETIKAVESGAVDVVIGTHRLLSKDVLFKDLGLLIVDEEQRFGVAHKERIKQLRKRVDAIAMSATPIPRTLNMSLAGLRDMSVIETPPRDRLAIQTHVVQFSEPVIRSAIELELQRGGQVFFVHNRVETIYAISELVGRLVPAARIAVGHGQMGERDLEDVMLKFIRHDLDVLVSTTIIENGIDIPLANTIIVNRSDMYGLAQLYQLRGRVGRSNRRAYAYLLIPSEESLTDVARRRLAAIREFSDLGAGFRIAALDLELRGAGNLLGSEQSGHIDAIGFDLYTQLLERTVRELKGEPVEEETSTSIALGVDIRIPEDYIFDASQRLRAYKRISSAADESELTEIRGEIEDRYGPVPATVDNLFEYSRLRRDASRLGIISIDREAERLAVKLADSSKIDRDKLIDFISNGRGKLKPSGVLQVALMNNDDKLIFDEIRTLLDALT